MPSTDTPRELVPVARDEERAMPMHGGPSPGAPKGNKNALKHGRYTADATISPLYTSADTHRSRPALHSLLYLNQRTLVMRAGMSGLCHNRTHAVQQTASLFDQLV